MENRICTILGIEKPVIQGPMVYLTDAKLVAAVSNSGGLGSLGPHAGRVDSTKDPIERAERLRAQVKQVKQLTDKPFSVNVLPSQHHEDNDLYTPPQLDVIFEEEVPVVTFVGESNKSMIRMFGQFKERGIKIVYRSLNPTPENTRAAEEAGATNEELGKKMGGFENLRIGMLDGDMDRGYVSVGNGITHIHEIKTAQQVIDELTADWR
jgi:enoyl-[acyl-carrier protein] reductase II